MIAPNIFQPRNNWNVISHNCRKAISMDKATKIAIIITNETGIDPLALVKYRGIRFVEARQLFMAMMYKHTNLVLREIGEYINKDHATILHSVKVVKDHCDTDKKFKALYDLIDTKIKLL